MIQKQPMYVNLMDMFLCHPFYVSFMICCEWEIFSFYFFLMNIAKYNKSSFNWKWLRPTKSVRTNNTKYTRKETQSLQSVNVSNYDTWNFTSD